MRNSWNRRAAAWLLSAMTAAVLPPVGEALADPPRVVASVKPLHSLVAAVMQGIAEPGLIIDATGSPHDYSLRPSEAAMLAEADIVVWVGPSLEGFLVRPVEALGESARVIELGDRVELKRLPVRTGAGFDPDDHDHGGDDHDHGEEPIDGHLWLDPQNGRAIVDLLAAELAQADPENGPTYIANADRAKTRIDEAVERAMAILQPVKDRRYVVFHDAYHYYEDAFGLSPIGAITVSPEQLPGADQVSRLRERIETAEAVCVFTEPQFEPRLARSLVEGTAARLGTLDPEGAEIENGPELYPVLLERLAASLAECLAD